MTVTRALQQVAEKLDESMGKRKSVSTTVHLAPQPRARNAHRRPNQQYGEIRIEAVIPDPTQPRTTFDEEELRELTASIGAKGQLSPIRVRWSEKEEKWIIIAGERRWQAAQLAGLEQIACYFHERELTDSEVLEEQLIENLQRQQLAPLDEAVAFQRLITLNGWSGKQLATALAIHPAKVSRSLALLKLPANIKQQLIKNRLSARTAYQLSRVKDPITQQRLSKQATEQKITPQQAAQHAGNRRKTKRSSQSIRQVFCADDAWTVTVANRKQSATYAEIEHALKQALEEVQLRIDSGLQLF